MAKLVFIHGLNTWGDDLLHLGPLTFGPMHARLVPALKVRDVELCALTELGAGSPEEIAERALDRILNSEFLESDERFHLIGQSIGGLVARALAARPELNERVISVMTIGTPHHGTEAARFALELADRRPVLHRILTAFGYDTRKRTEIFRHFLPESVSEFNRRYPHSNATPVISLICEVEPSHVSWPLRGAKIPGSDGFILSRSQQWGELEGPFALDHLEQLGFFFHLSAKRRALGQAEFFRMLDAIARRTRI